MQLLFSGSSTVFENMYEDIKNRRMQLKKTVIVPLKKVFEWTGMDRTGQNGDDRKPYFRSSCCPYSPPASM